MQTHASFAAIGEVRAFLRASLPDGWLPCDGRVLPIAHHAGLFEVLGARFGGDGEVTFALPDLVGRHPVHRTTDADTPVAPSQVLAVGSEARTRPFSPVIYAIAAPDPRRRRRGNLLAEDVVLGEVRLYAGVGPPKGWLPCDGQELGFGERPALGALLEGVYGGTDRETYRLPDLRGRALVCDARELPGPLGRRWLAHGQQGLLTVAGGAEQEGPGICHMIALAGQLPPRGSG